MSERIKDPLGVVERWREEQSPHQLTGWDDVKYPLAILGLVGLMVGSLALVLAGLLL